MITDAHLYVEKYSRGNLLVDFVEESEFIYFRNNGDYFDGMSLSEYEPTMLLFHHADELPLKEGDLFTLPIERLIVNKRRNDRDDLDSPVNVYMTFSDGDWLAELFEAGQALKENRLLDAFYHIIDASWENGSPCSLNQLHPPFTVEVVDVGQGSTNLIYDKNALTLFDCGTSVLSSRSMCRDTLNSMDAHFHRTRTISLIISHWDCDHYNLLTVMDDPFVRRFCCAFVPSQVISLTAKQAAAKLCRNCRYIRTFQPSPITHKRRVGMTPAIVKPNYELYVGEKSRSINKSGLALVVKGDSDTILFGADHSNDQIWSYIYPRTAQDNTHRLHMVVPHHGGRCGSICRRRLSEQAGIAAVSVGKNPYKHPNQEILDEYDRLHFEIKRTDWERNNIIIHMN